MSLKQLRGNLKLKEISIEREVETYKEYLIDINSLANAKQDKLKMMVEDMVINNPSQKDEIYDHYSEQNDIYNTKYIVYSNNASLVSSYSFFENQLKEIARYIDKYLVNNKGFYQKQKGLSYAENTRNEIHAMTGLDFSSLDSKWITLDQYRSVRNIIVHNGANLIDDTSQLTINQKSYPLISSFNQIEIEIDSGDFFIRDHNFIIDYLSMVQDYLQGLLNILVQLKDSDII